LNRNPQGSERKKGAARAQEILRGRVIAQGKADGNPGGPRFSTDSFLFLCFWACVGRVGLGLLLPALSTGSLDALGAEELAQGAGAITFVRQLGGAFGVNLLTFFLEWRHAAEGGHALAEAVAFRQSFWLMGALFLLAVWPAWSMGVMRRRRGA
jgi:hypothetical protein